MRKYLLSAALAAALIAPNAALAQSGHVDVSYGNHTYDFGGPEFEADVANIGGQVAFGELPLGVQIDGRYANWGGDADDVGVWGLGVHIYKRSPSWLIGGYVGYDDADDFNIASWTGAIEAQFYLSRATVSGILSYSEQETQGYAITLLEGEYRYFVTDNFSIQGGAGFGQGNISTSDPNVWSAQIGAEYQFADAPISVFGEYRYGLVDFDPGEIETNTFSIGVRYNWGGSLIDRNRRGAGLNRIIPVFERFIT
ncbi:MAG: outer membrane beta-barrel protein [Hyphomonadaceae bacterium]|nr:outer membrane beta-barrel protein [Hyphomonadaceae bacterium]GIK49287.1 MAG: hypothetical protein BroJett013_19840 [Alphaproteobacteria bacterium]